MNAETSRAIPFSDLPEGTVTFLFTDIEGSTQILHRLRDKYAILLEEHHRILREAFTNWDGHEVDTQGDAFFVAFSRATQAVGAAVEAQKKLTEHIWPERIPVKVRMGIHTGESWTGSEGYVGMEIHRAARIAHVASGGQVLLSETTTALVQDELPQGVTLLDLGRHLLKDIHRPERIHQLVIERLEAEFPPLTSLEMLPPESARPKRKVGVCPYRGLSAFQEGDAQFYFGRESFIDALQQAINTNKLVAVIVGSSGSGKSSALFAGLLPRLRKAGGFQFASFRPGNQPFYALAGALIPLLESGLSETDRLTETRKLAEALMKSEVSPMEVARRILEKTPHNRQVLLIIDQFEELYTLCPDPQVQKTFIDELLATVEASRNSKSGLAVILLTMRADFMGQALAHRPFADALQEASVLMGPMTRQELHVAIEKPAEMQGAAFEPGLVERILDDVGEKPGNLPLLEFTLTQLWERQDDGWLTHADYESMGCVEGALAAYADQVFSALDADDQVLARHAFVQLVQPGEGTEDTRRIATRDELGNDTWVLVQHLADRRLVVTGRDAQGRETVEVVHEALIQRWSRFRDWMNADRAFRLWQERLRASLRQWQDSDHDEGALLAGAPLAVAQDWLTERAGELNPAEINYIHASQAMQAKQLKDRQRRRQWTFAGLATGLIMALVLASIALFSSQRANRSAQTAQNEANARATQQVIAEAEKANAIFEANARATQQAIAESEKANAQAEALIRATAEADALRQADLARARELSLAAINNLGTDPELSILLALEAVSITQSIGGAIPPEVQDALHRAVLTSHLRLAYGTSGSDFGIAYSPDGSQLAIAIDAGTVLILDARTRQELFTLKGHNTGVSTIAYSPDGTQLASGDFEGQIILWSAKTGSKLENLVGHTDKICYLAYNPDGRILASASTDPTVRVWDTSTGTELAILPADKSNEFGDAPQVAFSPDGTRLISIGKSILWWDTGTWVQLEEFEGSAAAISPDGMHLAIGGMDGSIRLVDAVSGEEQLVMSGSVFEPIFIIKYSPDGTHLAGFGWNTGAVWDTETSQIIFDMSGEVGLKGIFTPDGSRLISIGQGGIARIWDVTTGKELYTLTGTGGLIDLAVSPDCDNLFNWCGEYLATAGRDETTVWDISPTGKSELLNIPGIQGEFSPDGKHFVSYLPEVDDLGIRIRIQTWNITHGMLGTIEFSHTVDLTSWPETFFISKDLSKAAWQTYDGSFTTFDLTNGLPIITFPLEQISYSRSWQTILAINPDLTRVVTLVDNSIQIWDATSGQKLLDLEDYPGTVSSYVYSLDGKFLAVAEGKIDDSSAVGDCYIHVLETDTYQEISSWLAHNKYIYDLEFSPDGTRLASSSLDMTAKVWRFPTGEQLLTLRGHSSSILYVIFNHDGTLLATLGFDNTKLWDASTGQNILTLPHNGRLITFSPDGKYFANADWNNPSVNIYMLDINELTHLARSRLTRGFTLEECQQYLHTETCPASP